MGKGNRTRGASKVNEQASAQGASSKWLKIGVWALVMAFTAVFIFALVQTTGLLQRNLTAITVGDIKLSGMDYNIFYADARTSFLSENGDYLSQLGYDFSAGFEAYQSPFGEEGQTWRDYFNDIAVENITMALVLYQEGKALGHEMSEDDLHALEDYIDGFQETADYYGITLDYLLSQTYGNSTKMSDVRRVGLITYYASSYANAKINTYEFSPEEIEAYYQENKNSFDAVDYYSYSFPYESFTYTAPAEGETLEEGQPASAEEAEAMTAQSKAEAEALAKEFIARIKAGSSFDAVAKEYFDAEQSAIVAADPEAEAEEFDTALNLTAAVSGSGATVDWIKDEARNPGDIDFVENTASGTIIVVQYQARYRKEVPTVDVRHILFSATKLTEEATEEQEAQYEVDALAALTQAEAVLALFNTGDGTEEAFGELAREYTADSNGEQGGLYERVQPGDMVDEFNDWLFDASRKPGDTDIVETKYGYHIMYFVKNGMPAYYYTIENTLISEAYNGYYDEVSPNYPVTVNEKTIVLNF